MGSRPYISSLVTCYFEEKTIEEFFERLDKVLEETGKSYEIIMVNDGSTDETWQKLKEIYEKNPRVRVIMDFAKNSGQLAAMTACTVEARGEVLFYLDSDLQLDPEDLPLLLEEYEKGHDLVTGYRKDRKDSIVRKIPSALANVIMRAASESTLRDFGCTFKLYNARIVKAFNFGPRHLFSNVELTRSIQSRRIKEVCVNHHERRVGASGWTFAKLWHYNMNNIVLLMERPFQYIGFLCFIASVSLVLRVAIDYWFPFVILKVVSNGLLLNALLFAFLATVAVLALIGELVIRNYAHNLALPRYIIREKFEREIAD